MLSHEVWHYLSFPHFVPFVALHSIQNSTVVSVIYAHKKCEQFVMYRVCEAWYSHGPQKVMDYCSELTYLHRIWSIASRLSNSLIAGKDQHLSGWETAMIELEPSVGHGRMPDSQSREPGFESPLLPFRSLCMFVLCTVPRFSQLYKWVPGYGRWWKCEWIVFARNCCMARMKEKSNRCQNEQVCQEVKCKVLWAVQQTGYCTM